MHAGSLIESANDVAYLGYSKGFYMLYICYIGFCLGEGQCQQADSARQGQLPCRPHMQRLMQETFPGWQIESTVKHCLHIKIGSTTSPLKSELTVIQRKEQGVYRLTSIEIYLWKGNLSYHKT